MFCGSFAEIVINRGKAWSRPGEVRPFRQPKTYTHARANQQADREGSVMLNLTAYRCTACRHDQVLTIGSYVNPVGEQWWNLDESDYHDEGSVCP